MRRFLLIFSLFFAAPSGHAEPCTIGAAHVAAVLQTLHFHAGDFSDGILSLTVTGMPTCAAEPDILIVLDQTEARSLSAVPSAGAVLFARARQVSGQLQISFTGMPEILQGLAAEWAREHTLRRFIKSISVGWFAYYSVLAEVQRVEVTDVLHSACAPGVAAEMTCARFATWTYTTAPACIANPVYLERLQGAVHFTDPFIQGSEPRVSIRGVTRDLCAASSERVPFLTAAANEIIFGDNLGYDRKQILQLAEIRVQGEIEW